jgi:hypothetical protein
MSTMSTKKQMESKIYKLVEFLGGHYGFDADEAFELSEDHVVALLPKEEKKVEEKKTEEKEKPSPLETARKNVALWTKKLEADKFKDDEAKEKHIAKLDKEKEKLAKLEPKVEVKPAAKPPTKAAKVEEKKPAEKEKRIKRMSPKLKESLKEVLDKAGVEMTDKVVKEFVEYVEKLTDEEFVPKGLADHMRDFAETKAPTDEDARGEEDEEEDEEEDTGAGTGLKPETKVPVQLTMEELTSISVTASVDPPGTFWDAENGRLVTGPDADDDEDISEVTFEGKTYGVGDKSGRVYLEVKDRDVFQGFIGVGKFKKMVRA